VVLLVTTFAIGFPTVNVFSELTASVQPIKLLIINSYSPDNVCSSPQQRGILFELAKAGYKTGKNLIVRIFYMDTKRRFTSPEEIEKRGEEALKEFYRFKPNVLVTLDDNAFRTVALRLVGQHVPIVFSGMNGQPEDYDRIVDWMETRKHPGKNITGVYENLHVLDALRIYKKLFPGIKKVVFITDLSPTGCAITKQIISELNSTPSFPCPWEFRMALSWEDYKKIIISLDRDPMVSAIYPVAVTLPSQSGKRFTAPEIFKWTTKHIEKPEIAVNHEFARMGLFGGAAVDFFSMGRQAGRMVIRILKGEYPGNIPIEKAEKYVLVFNLDRARELGIKIPQEILLSADEVIQSATKKQRRAGYQDVNELH